MKILCTDLILKYRDMARTIWNSAFWPNEEIRSGNHFIIGDYIASFDETVARLYEGMVLLPLGHECRVQDVNFPGKATRLMIEVSSPATRCLIDQDLPNNLYHRWEPHDLSLRADTYEFEFRNFFDWDQLGHRDFLFFEVFIRRGVLGLEAG